MLLRRGFPNYNNEIRHLSFFPALIWYPERVVNLYFSFPFFTMTGFQSERFPCTYSVFGTSKKMDLIIPCRGVTAQSLRERHDDRETEKRTQLDYCIPFLCQMTIDASPVINNTRVQWIYHKLTVYGHIWECSAENSGWRKHPKPSASMEISSQ